MKDFSSKKNRDNKIIDISHYINKKEENKEGRAHRKNVMNSDIRELLGFSIPIIGVILGIYICYVAF